MKKLSLFLCLLMLSMTTTQAGATSGLKQLVDEFNYSIQVEWDQKDKSFYNSEVKKFELGLEELQKEGLTAKEVMNFIESEVKDQNVVKAIKESMQFIDINKLDAKASRAILMNNMEKTYKKGANWSGDAALIGTYIALIAAFAILVTIIAIAAPKSSGGGSSSGSSSSGGSSSNGSYDNDSSSDSSWSDYGSSDSGSGDSGSGDSGSGDSGSGDSGSGDSGSSDSGSGDSGSGDSDGDGWGDDWDWIRRPTL